MIGPVLVRIVLIFRGLR